MRIIHYLFGLPPVRTGGLIKYALDLAYEQSDLGHEVLLMCPGYFKGKDTTRTGFVKSRFHGLDVIRIVNPLPIPMTSGILDVELFTKPADKEAYKELVGDLKPDVFHVHNFMGLHIELLRELKNKNVKIMYTTHDYFGLCPTATLFKNGEICAESDYNQCMLCCQHAFSKKVLVRQQSRAFIYYKKSRLIEYMKKSKKLVSWREKKKLASAQRSVETGSTNVSQYACLKKYYDDLFGMVDVFLFNSSLAEDIFKKRLGNIQGYYVDISHSDIQDRRVRKAYSSDNQLNIAYMGPPVVYKGYDILLKSLDKLAQEKAEFCLHVYFEKSKTNSRDYIKHHEHYTYSRLTEVMKEADVVVVPSIWLETYGFIVKEAISCGVPVITTDCVGAQDYVRQHNAGWVISANESNIYQILANIYRNRQLLADVNEQICKAHLTFDFRAHAKGIIQLYESSKKEIMNYE